ncbi:hypothetical protein GCM10010357_01050 [Streptomyces luteireticuli]|uniref:Uncharacterized protein n=1 Tax=Streptomyces luteireticuli TaxID=173858 RepID=A0ABN0Y5I3_9ACTN
MIFSGEALERSSVAAFPDIPTGRNGESSSRREQRARFDTYNRQLIVERRAVGRGVAAAPGRRLVLSFTNALRGRVA